MLDQTAVSAEMFVPASREEQQGVQSMREPVSYWTDAFRRFRKNKVAVVSAYFLVFITLFAIIGPFFAKYSYSTQTAGSENIAPFVNWDHPFGTDGLGRDLYVRLLIGARISLAIGIITSIIVVIIGVLYGTISAYFGGVVDTIMMRIVDVLYAVPSLLVIILLSVIMRERFAPEFNHSPLLNTLGTGLISIFITFGLLYWLDMARMVRGQILSLKQTEYVNAARAVGAGSWRIMRKHLIPNSLGVIIVTATLNIPTAIFSEAFLSFIGLGVSVPMASLGSLASDAIEVIYIYPYQLILPSILISLIILSFNLVGDGLRDALDPRMKSKG